MRTRSMKKREREREAHEAFVEALPYHEMSPASQNAFQVLVSAVNIRAFNDTSGKAEGNWFLSWDVLEDIMPFLKDDFVIRLIRESPQYYIATRVLYVEKWSPSCGTRQRFNLPVKENQVTKYSDNHSETYCALNGFLYWVGTRPTKDFGTQGYIECMNLTTGATMEEQSTPELFHTPGFAGMNGILYILGGQPPNYKQLGKCFCYHPKTKQWSSIAPMNLARRNCVAGVAAGSLFVVGGWVEGHGRVKDIEKYDESLDMWTHIQTERPLSNVFYPGFKWSRTYPHHLGTPICLQNCVLSRYFSTSVVFIGNEIFMMGGGDKVAGELGKKSCLAIDVTTLKTRHFEAPDGVLSILGPPREGFAVGPYVCMLHYEPRGDPSLDHGGRTALSRALTALQECRMHDIQWQTTVVRYHTETREWSAFTREEVPFDPTGPLLSPN